jgi:Galactose oxidase, central domain
MDTWLWSQKEDIGPSPRRGHAMVYDSNKKIILLVGGASGSLPNPTTIRDTWQWDGTSWEQVADTGPSSRFGHAMAYDSARQKTVLFGGTTGGETPSFYRDTWEWDGSEWIQVADTGPIGRQSHAMAYDSARQKTVLFGGYTAIPIATALPDTWEWDGSEWIQVADTGPSRRYGHVMAYDSTKQNVLLSGGYGNTFLGDTWELNKNSWKQLQDMGPAVTYGSMTDSNKGITIFGGLEGATNVETSKTWRWTGKFWVQVQDMGPPPRRWHSMAYDTERDRVVLFGGILLTNTNYGDTWELEVQPSV